MIISTAQLEQMKKLIFTQLMVIATGSAWTMRQCSFAAEILKQVL